jgi:hypothetical protein
LTPLDSLSSAPALRDATIFLFFIFLSEGLQKTYAEWIGFGLRDREILSLFQEQWCVKYKMMKIGLGVQPVLL